MAVVCRAGGVRHLLGITAHSASFSCIVCHMRDDIQANKKKTNSGIWTERDGRLKHDVLAAD